MKFHRVVHPIAVSSMVLFATSAGAQAATPQGEWRGINGGASSTRYSPLDQLNASNDG